MFSQHSGHSRFGCPCRPCSCSHAKYAAPATSSKLRPLPKGRPRLLGMGRCIAVHLYFGKAARPERSRGADASSVTPSGRIDCRVRRRCPRLSIWSASLTASWIRRSRTTTEVGVSHAMLSLLVTHRARDPPIWRRSPPSRVAGHRAHIRVICGLPIGGRRVAPALGRTEHPSARNRVERLGCRRSKPGRVIGG